MLVLSAPSCSQHGLPHPLPSPSPSPSKRPPPGATFFTLTSKRSDNWWLHDVTANQTCSCCFLGRSESVRARKLKMCRSLWGECLRLPDDTPPHAKKEQGKQVQCGHPTVPSTANRGPALKLMLLIRIYSTVEPTRIDYFLLNPGGKGGGSFKIACLPASESSGR